MMQENNFPVRKMKIKLKKSTPSELTVEVLQKQLNGIGLTCGHTSKEALTKYKIEVMRDLPKTSLQTFGLMRPANGFSEAAFLDGQLGESDKPYIKDALNLEKAAVGEWEWDDTAAGYQLELAAIQVPAHFDYLMQNRPGFIGQKLQQQDSGNLTSVDAIKGLFIKTAKTASDTFGKNINSTSIEAFYSNAISPLSEGDVSKDYNKSDSRILLLTLNNDPGNDQCDGIAVINVSWHIVIKNYQRKSKNGGDYHDTSITVVCRGAFYSNPEVLAGDYNAIKNAFKDSQCLMNEPDEAVEVPVLPQLPPAGRETFIQGLPTTITDEYIDSTIFHSVHSRIQKDAMALEYTGFDEDCGKMPVSHIDYALRILPPWDIDTGNEGMLLSLPSSENKVSETLFEHPVDLEQAVLDTSVLRYSLLDGSYQYVKSGKFYANLYKVIGGKEK